MSPLADLSAARAAAWKTRRAKYGERGHSGAYACHRNVGALRMVINLHREAVLSEGQVAHGTGLDRVEIRRLVQEQGGYVDPPVIEPFNAAQPDHHGGG